MELIGDKELENMSKAIAEIGTAKTCVTEPIIKRPRRPS
jgi:hypothetical protein